MEHVYKSINNIQTHLITWGNPFDCNGQDVIICITGNPGLPDFYTEFCTALYENNGFPVCVVGQAGHEEVPDNQSNVLKGQEHLFDLEGQIQHKLDLINNHIDKRSKLHIIGHSIGAWLILELVQKDIYLSQRLSSVNLLFPTLQRMAETKSGRYLNNILRRINVFILILFKFLFSLPTTIISTLVNIYLKVNSLPLHYKSRIFKFINPKVGEKVLFLAYNEMDTVNKLNTDAMTKIKNICNVIYSPKDTWAPITYMDDLKQFQPPLLMHEVNIDHSFVLRSSETVAEMVSNFIMQKCNDSVNDT